MALNTGRHKTYPQVMWQQPVGWGDVQGGEKEGTNSSSSGSRVALHILTGFCGMAAMAM